MNPFDLPAELRDVERRLVERTRPQPDAAFRRRVLAAMHGERTATHRDRIRRDLCRWVATLAAVVLLGLNLAMSLANHRAGPGAMRMDGDDIAAAAHTLQQCHPDLSEREAYQWAAQMRTPPPLPVPTNKLIPLIGEESWDMH